MMARMVLVLVLVAPIAFSGCIDTARTLVALSNDLAEQLECEEAPRTVHEERGRAVVPAPLADPIGLGESGQAAIVLGDNFTIITWSLGRFGVGGTPNIAYDASFSLSTPGGADLWADGADGLTNGYNARLDILTLPSGRYFVTWDVRGAGTEYMFRVEEAPCLRLAELA